LLSGGKILTELMPAADDIKDNNDNNIITEITKEKISFNL